ncbi:MAG: COX15/CtaA family protein [Acidiferrobacterales bacterium]
MKGPQSERYRTQVAIWLLICCAFVLAMVVLGGVTRLTRSGLSMVDWDPIMGVVPPLNQAQWEQVFSRYQQFPEYQQINRNISLTEFKFIFWMEYAHRLLGRVIALVFLLPFLYFLTRRRIDRPLIPKLIGMFALGGLQGLLGWFMVKSGLFDEPHVSPYRLTAHLVLAVIIYGYILWVALGLLFPKAEHSALAFKPIRRFGLAVTGIIGLTILSGGFVAGTKAGFAFNTFPLMNGRLVPQGMLGLNPLWRNFFENIATVQFDHRLIAYLLCITIAGFWYKATAADLQGRAHAASHALLAVLAIQVGLGITTLLLIVPMPLAAAHQGGALLLLTVAIFINHELRRGPTPLPRRAATTSLGSVG